MHILRFDAHQTRHEIADHMEYGGKDQPYAKDLTEYAEQPVGIGRRKENKKRRYQNCGHLQEQ